MNRELAMEIACDLAEKAMLKDALNQRIISSENEAYIEDNDEVFYTEDCQSIFDEHYDYYMNSLEEYIN